jgi:hypothetical protein
LIGEHTATWAFLPLNAHYALRADGHGRSRSRNGGRGRHAFGRQYRVWDAFVTDRAFEEFCKKHGDQIYMELLDPPIAKWLVSEYGVPEIKTKGGSVSQTLRHALVIRTCQCGRKIAGNPYFLHVRACRSAGPAAR